MNETMTVILGNIMNKSVIPIFDLSLSTAALFDKGIAQRPKLIFYRLAQA